MKKKTLTVNHESGYNYSFIMFSASEAKEVIIQFDGVLLDKYTNEENDNKVYLLNDGKVLQISFVHAFLFSSLYGFLLSMKEADFYKKKIPKNFPIKRIVITKDFEEIIFYELEKTPETNGESIFEDKFKKVIELPNKQILFIHIQGICLQFENIKEYKVYTNHKEFVYPDIPPNMRGKNIHGEEFPNYVDDLIDDLKLLLEIPDKVLNLKEESLFELDKYLYANVISDEFSNKIFLPLLAYVGKVFISNFGGKWEMEYNEKYNTWSPNIITSNGKIKKIYVKLDEMLDSNSEEVSSLFFIMRF